MSFHADDVLPQMIAAAKSSLLADWQANGPAVELQLQQLAQQTEALTVAVAQGKFNNEQVPFLFDMEKQAAISCVAEMEGIGKIAAENAINSALAAVSSIINGAVGFALV